MGETTIPIHAWQPIVLRRLATAALLTTLVSCGSGNGWSSNAGSTATNPTTPTAPTGTTSITKAEAYRFLNQATFGATDAAVQQVVAQGYEAWIDAQLLQPPVAHLPDVFNAYVVLPQPVTNVGPLQDERVSVWFTNAVRGTDQLRQRVAFALSQIMVVSQVSLSGYPLGIADYYDMLARNSFGDFRTLIEEVTLHPMMGVYLSMLGNQKPDAARNIRPDENYARELMQLFTIGLVELNLDGGIKRDSHGQPLPTYNQAIIEGFAHVFTGWTWARGADFSQAQAAVANQVLPMQVYTEQHDTGAKRVLSYAGAALTSIPAGQVPAADLKDALDNVFGHPNVAPFISKQLIQRLVTSNPSPQYVQRVAQKFNDDGFGKRGNLGAVVKAILLDSEARAAPTAATSGKIKEPLLRITQLWRAYDAQAANGKLQVANLPATFGQGPLQAPSVFNFFSPFHAPPGEISNQDLVAPELQIATEYFNTQVTRYIYAAAFCYVPTPVAGCAALRPETVVLDTRAEMAIAADSEALVNKVADRLLGGEISATLKSEAKALVERSSVASSRVAEAVYLIASSPEFALQR